MTFNFWLYLSKLPYRGSNYQLSNKTYRGRLVDDYVAGSSVDEDETAGAPGGEFRSNNKHIIFICGTSTWFMFRRHLFSHTGGNKRLRNFYRLKWTYIFQPLMKAHLYISESSLIFLIIRLSMPYQENKIN